MNVCALKPLNSSFVVIKIIVGVNLVSYATRRRAGMEEREAADAVNDFGRDPIGEGKEEQVLFSFSSKSLQLRLFLYNPAIQQKAQDVTG